MTVVKTCPWCGGALRFEAAFPVAELFPREFEVPPPEGVPEALRTRPAWVCATSHCRYREPA